MVDLHAYLCAKLRIEKTCRDEQVQQLALYDTMSLDDEHKMSQSLAKSLLNTIDIRIGLLTQIMRQVDLVEQRDKEIIDESR